MKEFALKHPFLTFFIADAIVSGVVKIVAMLTGNVETGDTTTNEEDSEDEPANDIK